MQMGHFPGQFLVVLVVVVVVVVVMVVVVVVVVAVVVPVALRNHRSKAPPETVSSITSFFNKFFPQLFFPTISRPR